MPTVTKNLIIINVLVFFGTLVAQRYGIDLTNYLGLHFFLASDFNPAQLITYMFMHGGFSHIFFNMFAVFMFGTVLERTWGPKRFLFYYIACGIGAGLIQEGVQYIKYIVDYSHYSQVDIGTGIIPMGEFLNMLTTVGASGAVYAILLAFGMLFPNNQLFIFPLPFPIKAKFFVIGYALIELYAGFANNPGDEKGGHIAVETGRKVTIKLIPDYGWQVAGLTLNGGEKLTPDDDNVSTFTFVMGDSNIHLKGLFEKASDEIKIDKGNTVKSVSISNGKNAVASGNLALTVSDNTSYDSQKEQAVAEGAVYVSAVDFTLQQLVSKGNGSAWVSDVREFEKPVTLNVSIDDYDENYDYIVIRNHNGEITKLDTTANEGTISFETNRFSTYVILKKEKSGAGQDSSDTAESGVDAGIGEIKNSHIYLQENAP